MGFGMEIDWGRNWFEGGTWDMGLEEGDWFGKGDELGREMGRDGDEW